jgi:hypothetical protein
MIYQRLRAAVAVAAVAEIHAIVASAFLADLRAGRSDLRAVRHPLGFACLPVLRDGDDGVCVHVWPEGRDPAPRTTSPYHCHSWDLLSHVLYGAVGNQPVEVSEGTTYRVFEARSTPMRDDLVATDRFVDAHGLTPEMWQAGQTYSLPAGAFHASVIDRDTVAATVVLGRHHPEQPDLTLGSPVQGTHRVTRELCTAEETRAYAELVAARITPLVEAAAQ